MGVLRPGNGGSLPPDDGGPSRDGLPGLPPEWGTIVIPDDASELAHDAEAFRREVRRHQRRNRIRGFFGMQPTRPGEPTPSVGVPLVIMVVAVLTTLISLFVVTWDRRPVPPVTVVTDPATSAGSASAQATAATPLTELPFTDALGHTVRLGTLLPAVILLVDGCDCADLIIRAAGIVPAGVSVVAAGHVAPKLAAPPAKVHALADPQGILRARYAPASTPPTARPAVLFVTGSGAVLTTLPAAASLDEIKAALARFPGTSGPTPLNT